MDSESVITGWNKQAELIFGWKNDEGHRTANARNHRAPSASVRHIFAACNIFLSTGEGPVPPYAD